jgi:tartrate dehydratase beta subunit/fumarate hydratase class I family protein
MWMGICTLTSHQVTRGMGKDTLNAMQKYGAIYVATVGAASVVLARCVTKVINMIDPNIWLCELEVKSFNQAIVGMDTYGHNLFEDIREKAGKKAKELIEVSRIRNFLQHKII